MVPPPYRSSARPSRAVRSLMVGCGGRAAAHCCATICTWCACGAVRPKRALGRRRFVAAARPLVGARLPDAGRFVVFALRSLNLARAEHHQVVTVLEDLTILHRGATGALAKIDRAVGGCRAAGRSRPDQRVYHRWLTLILRGRAHRRRSGAQCRAAARRTVAERDPRRAARADCCGVHRSSRPRDSGNVLVDRQRTWSC